MKVNSELTTFYRRYMKFILSSNFQNHSIGNKYFKKSNYENNSQFRLFRRWFLIRNGQLLYMKRSNINTTNDNSQQQCPYTTLISDLRLCTVRHFNDSDRRFVFEIISPNRQKYFWF